MDGNGRWAKERNLKRTAGHAEGAKTLENIINDADDIGIKYLTVYAFSTENWARPSDEVDMLMKLMDKYLRKCIKMSIKHNFRARVIGDRSKLNDNLNSIIDDLEETSANFDGLNLQIAINYGSRDEILRGIRQIAFDVKNGDILPENIDENLFSSVLDTSDIPEPDLLIRTSGEKRLSNFMLWQIAYSELYFTDVYWPDFDRAELLKAVAAYSNRNRTYGKISNDKDSYEKPEEA